jgi:hypothetical protein
MANRPKRKKPTPAPVDSSDPVLDLDEGVVHDKQNKAFRNNPKIRKPFVNYISLKNYKPKGLDKQHGR